ncbi:phage tail tape measure protein [Rhizobium sp. CFBP 8762]|uniref:phage tail tape measure protein n=1 Tax=Rhizobium sp. CFBP 8762 TaxID=2775279 RepID=UPI00177E152F|nr:phage tail tape measure protein [Rhizobium sp. CFBP 8762]MBD8553172.1 phage tail tape measure protein [Rhizobium sp. CFBP 8762]
MDDERTVKVGFDYDAEPLKRVFDDLEGRSRSFGRALTSALTGAARDGKGLEDSLRGVALRISAIALSAGMKPVESLLSSAVSSLLGGNLLGGKVKAFADGGVVSSPTYFPLSGGMGLMGEAGAEAILPLKRGADGSLGVAAGAGGGGVNVTFNVTATDVASFRKSEGQISAMLTRTVARGRRGL